MRKLLGYCCHVASVRLHEAAVGMMFVCGEGPRTGDRVECLWCQPDSSCECEVCDGTGWVWRPITLADVAPRLAAACEAVRGHVERVRRRMGL